MATSGVKMGRRRRVVGVLPPLVWYCCSEKMDSEHFIVNMFFELREGKNSYFVNAVLGKGLPQ